MTSIAFPKDDLSSIISLAEKDLAMMAKSRIVIYGGTGFVGRWLVSTLIVASNRLDLNLEIALCSRNVARAAKMFPNSRSCKISFHDSRNTPRIQNANFLVHASTPSNPTTGSQDVAAVVENTTITMKQLLSIAKESDKPSLMHLSSGIVYRKDRNVDEPFIETSAINLLPETSYAEAKFNAEQLVTVATEQGIVKGSNPRLFSFVGPHLDISGHYAIGDFMSKSLLNKKITIQGSPNTLRSYMYPSDLIVWLLRVLNNPSLQPTNIGSTYSISMLELAELFMEEFGTAYEIDSSQKNKPSFYVPETFETRKRLALYESIPLRESLVKWRCWLQS